MTKEELIESSDLNREDNIKYISSEAQGIAITLDSDRCAPTLCKLERAYICGRRKSEEQIAELEKENAELKADNDARKFAMAMSEKVEKQLREENEELKEKLGDVQMQKAGEKSDLVWKLKTANEQKAEQLTKAKEIIEGLMRFCRCFAQHHTEDIRYKEAEQFLNSEVEK